MPVVGVGIDVVEIDRFEASLERTPGLRDRLFTAEERGRPPASLAARFAAKEALAKALGAPVGLAWQDAEIVSEESGRPRFELAGTVLGPALVPGPVLHLDSYAGPVYDGLPEIGEHTAPVLGELLGISGQELAALDQAEVVGSNPAHAA